MKNSARVFLPVILVGILAVWLGYWRHDDNVNVVSAETPTPESLMRMYVVKGATKKATASIGQEGGGVLLDGEWTWGAGLMIPEGAVAKATKFTVEVTNDRRTMQGYQALSPMFKLGPADVKLAKPVYVALRWETFPLPDGITPTDVVVMREVGEGASEVVPGSVGMGKDNRGVGLIGQLGRFWLAAPVKSAGAARNLGDWIPIQQRGMPTSRRDFAAASVGGKVYVWGGLSDSSATEDGRQVMFGDGSVYDPGTDTWSSMTSTGAPKPRSQHVMLVSEQRLLVWGGYQYGEFHTDGGIYDTANGEWKLIPAGPEWLRTSLGDVTSTAWTGRDLVVWKQSIQRGARYSEATGEWTEMATENATDNTSEPSHHKKLAVRPYDPVWCLVGEDLMVWGSGYTQGGPGRGAKYSIESDTWTPMSTDGAPVPQSVKCAIAVNGRMVMFANGPGPRTSVVRISYDPIKNLWESHEPVAARTEWSVDGIPERLALVGDLAIFLVSGENGERLILSAEDGLDRMRVKPGTQYRHHSMRIKGLVYDLKHDAYLGSLRPGPIVPHSHSSVSDLITVPVGDRMVVLAAAHSLTPGDGQHQRDSDALELKGWVLKP